MTTPFIILVLAANTEDFSEVEEFLINEGVTNTIINFTNGKDLSDFVENELEVGTPIIVLVQIHHYNKFLQRFSTHRKTETIPVFVITEAEPTVDLLTDLLVQGVHGILSRPYNMQFLQSLIQQLRSYIEVVNINPSVKE